MITEEHDNYLRDPIVIGHNLKQLRISKERTISFISQNSNLSTSYISLVETGKRRIDPISLREILLCLDITLGYFCSQILLHQFDFQANDSLTVKSNQNMVLLAGSRKEDSYSILQSTTVHSITEQQSLVCTLPANTLLAEREIQIKSPILLFCLVGTFLVLRNKKELVVKENQQIQFDGSSKFIIRNYRTNTCKFLMFLSDGGF